MLAITAKSPSLVRALRNRVLVRFTRPFEPGRVHGYVLGIGPKFFMVAVVDESQRFDGFQCFRLSDVRNLKVPDPFAGFAEAALKKRGERLPRKPPIDLRTMPRLLQTANKAFPLVTIHREAVDGDICHIGRLVHVDERYVWLLEIGPDARWDKEPLRYRLNQITRVDFGGGYEEALHLVGGAPKRRRIATQSPVL